jgi:hypothetical protein
MKFVAIALHEQAGRYVVEITAYHVVDAQHHLAICEKSIGEMATEKTSHTRNEDPHLADSLLISS